MTLVMVMEGMEKEGEEEGEKKWKKRRWKKFKKTEMLMKVMGIRKNPKLPNDPKFHTILIFTTSTFEPFLELHLPNHPDSYHHLLFCTIQTF